MNEKSITSQIVDFRDLTLEQQEKTLSNYSSKLAQYTEVFTSASEIKEAIKDDENFYIFVLLVNDEPKAHIQFKYFEDSKMIFIDYVYMILENDIFTTNVFYSFLEEKVFNAFNIDFIVTEVSFSSKRKNRALERLLSYQGFAAFNFKYIQPPTETILPTTGRLLIKPYKKDFSINKIIKDIYFNHYAYWYRKVNFYKFKISCLYLIQKLLIKVNRGGNDGYSIK